MLLVGLTILLGSLAGAGLCWFLIRISEKSRLRVAKAEAESVLQEAKDSAAEILDEIRTRTEEIEEEVERQYTKEITNLQKSVQAREEQYRGKRSQGDRDYNQDLREVQQQMAQVREQELVVEKREQRYNDKKQILQNLQKELRASLARLSEQNPEDIKAQLLQSVENELQVEARRKATEYEDEIRAQAESIAKRIIGIALNRFAREACVERGIGLVELPNADVKARFLANEGAVLQHLQKLCGVDVSINDNNVFQVSGYDPVRRELTTRLLEKLIHEKNLNAALLERLFEKTKREVFKKIEEDGRRVAAELGMQSLHAEIKNMLGSLRYRYSFAQNQHFHVAEVGWLCGLLAAELGGVDVHQSKRSGLLHDIGKAMDHSIEGGHAVIGADFIQKYGEAETVVHAVRAHHYEEQPQTDLAYLVIAADAISGARPGARRSTVTAYNQKIEALSTIADGFKGVTKTLVFNAGREVRILVDAVKINDESSLHLCREIADKIEEECSYPGQIKVVVVRETVAESVAK